MALMRAPEVELSPTCTVDWLVTLGGSLPLLPNLQPWALFTVDLGCLLLTQWKKNFQAKALSTATILGEKQLS